MTVATATPERRSGTHVWSGSLVTRSTRMRIDLRGITGADGSGHGPLRVDGIDRRARGAGEVVAVTRNSPWGTASEAVGAVRRLVEHSGIEARIRFHEGHARDVAAGCDVVTNLGFVRPIDRATVEASARTPRWR